MASVLFFLCFVFSTALALDESLTNPACTAQFLEDKHRHSLQLNSSSLNLFLHHIRSPCSPLGLQAPTASDVLNRDNYRVSSLLTRLAGNSTLVPSQLRDSKANIPLSPGSSYGIGNYITRVSLGSPAKSYVVIVDTGSSLSWVQCQPCKLSCYSQKDAIYDPKGSQTYSTMPCTAPQCKALTTATLNAPGCSLDKVCVYQASYGDGSYSVGYLSRDTLQVSGAVLPGFVFGCGQDNEGLFGQAAGLFGLARDSLSMLTQLAPKYGNAFSYCLPTASASSGYLSLGAYSPAGYSFTAMLSGSGQASLYFIKLSAIYVAGRPIAVSPVTLSGTPTIIDSGTVITRLPTAVYTALSRAVVASMGGYQRAPAYSILDTCYKGSYTSLKVPAVRIVFAGGAEMNLSPHNVFYDLPSSGITCLAFAPSTRTAIIGNRQQQTFRVVYDVAGNKIGFSPGGGSIQ